MPIAPTTQWKRTLTQHDFDRFAALSGDDNPIHVDAAFSARSKFGQTVAHGMLLYSLIGRCLGAQLPGPGCLPIAQELMFPNPTFAGQEITLRLALAAQPPADAVEITTDILRPDGQPGCLGKALVRLPGAALAFHPPVDNPAPYRSEAQTHRGLRIGQSAQSRQTFSPAALNEFLALTGETNPIYTDRAYAQRLGLRDVLLPGGLLGGAISRLLGVELPGRGANWLKQKYVFLRPAHPGDTLTAAVSIVRLRPEKDLVTLRTTLAGPRGELVMDGEALIGVSDLHPAAR